MLIKGIKDEVFQDYKKVSMLIATSKCDWKCLRELNLPLDICQNSELAKSCSCEINLKDIIKRYDENFLSQAIIFAGLEPILQIDEILYFIEEFRILHDDDIIIYTGYYPNEIKEEINKLKKYKNIIIKFGRFIPNKNSKYDKILGIELISDNQFAEKIS